MILFNNFDFFLSFCQFLCSFLGNFLNFLLKTFKTVLDLNLQIIYCIAVVLEFESSRLCTDVSSALEYLTNLFHREKFDGCLPSIVLKHQLYSILPSRTAVDKKLVKFFYDFIKMITHSSRNSALSGRSHRSMSSGAFFLERCMFYCPVDYKVCSFG